MSGMLNAFCCPAVHRHDPLDLNKYDDPFYGPPGEMNAVRWFIQWAVLPWEPPRPCSPPCLTPYNYIIQASGGDHEVQQQQEPDYKQESPTFSSHCHVVVDSNDQLPPSQLPLPMTGHSSDCQRKQRRKRTRPPRSICCPSLVLLRTR